MHWRALLRATHRDVGYLLTALTVGYAISGVAVNHVDDWNPNYQIAQQDVAVGPLPHTAEMSASLGAMERHVAAALHLSGDEIKGRLQSDIDEFTVFLLKGGEVKVRISDGRGRMKRVTPRAGLFQLNVLHLNHLKGVWTWVADAFALALAALAISGLFMLKGRKGLSGRGKWWVAAGLVVPVAAIISYYAAS